MTLSTFESEPTTTTEPMVVYKIIGVDNRSQWHDFQYEPNQTYRIDGGLKIDNQEELEEFNDPPPAIISRGFHAYTVNGAITRVWHGCLARCMSKMVAFTIPCGSKVFHGQYGDIVSDCIVAGDLNAISDDVILSFASSSETAGSHTSENDSFAIHLSMLK